MVRSRGARSLDTGRKELHVLIVDLFGGLEAGVELAVVQQLLVLGLEQGVAIACKSAIHGPLKF